MLQESWSILLRLIFVLQYWILAVLLRADKQQMTDRFCCAFVFHRKPNGWPLRVTMHSMLFATSSRSSMSLSVRCCWSMFLFSCSGASNKVELSVTRASHGVRPTVHCSLVVNGGCCTSVLIVLTCVIRGKGQFKNKLDPHKKQQDLWFKF